MPNSPELIAWSRTFMCGIKTIDDQHKGLVDLVNDMFNHVTGDDDEERQYLNKIIEETVNYIKVHFSTEEKIMNATKFPGYIEHKEEHKKFIITVAKHIEYFNSGKRVSLMSLSRFLKEWILSHIAVVDKQYFVYFRTIATRKADGGLIINSADGKIEIDAQSADEELYSSAKTGGI